MKSSARPTVASAVAPTSTARSVQPANRTWTSPVSRRPRCHWNQPQIAVTITITCLPARPDR